jgi:co-chaperonin GroES (HSP10)
MALIPLGNRLVVKKAKVEETTQKGIVLLAQSQEAPPTATVIAVGKGEKAVMLGLKPGDTVVIDPRAGMAVKIDDEELTLMDQQSILAVIKED